jgi:hypothetical protein
MLTEVEDAFSRTQKVENCERPTLNAIWNWREIKGELLPSHGSPPVARLCKATTLSHMRLASSLSMFWLPHQCRLSRAPLCFLSVTTAAYTSYTFLYYGSDSFYSCAVGGYGSVYYPTSSAGELGASCYQQQTSRRFRSPRESYNV